MKLSFPVIQVTRYKHIHLKLPHSCIRVCRDAAAMIMSMITECSTCMSIQMSDPNNNHMFPVTQDDVRHMYVQASLWGQNISVQHSSAYHQAMSRAMKM